MTWLAVALIAYFLFAVVTLTDRYLLRSSLPVPFSYAFYVGIFSLFGSGLILAISQDNGVGHVFQMDELHDGREAGQHRRAVGRK